MGEKPSFIDLHVTPLDPSSRLGLPSPRAQYNDGEIPPSLSPLDAFAAQSRLMAKQLDVNNTGEKRMSRLAPAMVTKSLSQHRAKRPTVFRAFSEKSAVGGMGDEDGFGSNPTIASSLDRHMSLQPRISGVPTTSDDDANKDGRYTTPVDQPETPESTHQPPQSDYFGLLRTDSPSQITTLAAFNMAPLQAKAEPSSIAPGNASRQQRRSRNDSSISQPELTFATSPHVRPVPPPESSDDDYSSSIAGSSFSNPRKLSSSSGISAPYSPPSPFIPVYPPRSPSIRSDASVNGVSAQRVPLNFSRPRSTASLSIASRADSPAIHQPQSWQHSTTIQDTSHVAVQSPDADSVDNDGYLSGGGSSYTYAKFSLPRGRMVSRDSAIFQGLSTPHFEWQQPLFQNTPLTSEMPEERLTSPSPPRSIRDPQDNCNTDKAKFAFDFQSARPSTTEQPCSDQPSISSPQSFESAKPATSSLKSPSCLQTSDLKSSRAPAPSADAEEMKSISSRSNSTLRPMSSRTGRTNGTGCHYLSPEDHLAKGIECHENGSLQESTYHLRIAAMQNHPTAMLLYALACRHGWGMRPNQREGVQWLRKALDSAMLEVAEDEDPSSATGIREIHDKKARRAQFALGIYELGVSHLNGWGTEKDKALALRCFEVAGYWGDVDALTEAGFCYAKGLGCKKDLKQAAKFYRMAEQRGVSMVGSSWIYKDKYNDANEMTPPVRSPAPSRDKKTGDKSRTRILFGRKKSFQQA